MLKPIESACAGRETAPVQAGGLPPVLTIMEVANYLRIGRTMAYELARRRDFPALRIGRAVRIPRDRFLAWLEGQRQGQAE